MSPQTRSALARADHRTTVRGRPAGRPHTHAGRPAARRVSGPGPRAQARVQQGTLVGDVLRSGVLRALPGRAAAAAAAPAPALPRRTGGTVVRRPRVIAGAGRVRTSGSGVLDTLLRSRAWIWLIGVLLGGIVAMQVSLLKLNTGIGRAVTTMSTLERQNAGLEAQIARLSSGERIQSAAVAAGLVMPDAGSIGYLSVREGDARRAAARMQAPSAQAEAVMKNGGVAPGAAAPATAEPVVTAPPATAPEATAPATPPPAPTTAPDATAAPVTTTPAPPAPTGEG